MKYEISLKEVKEDFEKSIIPSLSDYIKIENGSPYYDPEWMTNGKLEESAEHILKWSLNQNIIGLKGEIIKDKNKVPLVFIEIEPFGNSNKTAVLYGHHDKQPPLNNWTRGLDPRIPVIKENKLYGRGVADDGYAIYACIESIKLIQNQKGVHGKIFIIMEGAEESASLDLIYYLNKLSNRIKQPNLLICLDSGCLNYDAIWLTTSLRGVCIIDLTVECLKESVHSGSGSGIAPDSFTVLRQLLDRLDDPNTSKANDLLNVNIPDNIMNDAKKISNLFKGQYANQKIKLINGVKPLTEDYLELILNNTWKTIVVVTGMSGFPPVEKAGNVLRNKTSCRISLRIPPTLDNKKAENIVVELLNKNIPYNAIIKTEVQNGGNGWVAKELSQSLKKSFTDSSKFLFNNDYYNYGEGLSIPFISKLNEMYPDCEIVVTGVVGPGSNCHCPDESLNLEYTKKFIVALAHAINDYCLY